MSLEDLTGSNKFITNLVPANPGSGDDKREGDDHIRGIKNVLANTFPGMGTAFVPAEYAKLAGATFTGPVGVTGPLLSRDVLNWTDTVNSTGRLGIALGAVTVGSDGSIDFFTGLGPDPAAGRRFRINSDGVFRDAEELELGWKGIPPSDGTAPNDITRADRSKMLRLAASNRLFVVGYNYEAGDRFYLFNTTAGPLTVGNIGITMVNCSAGAIVAFITVKPYGIVMGWMSDALTVFLTGDLG